MTKAARALVVVLLALLPPVAAGKEISEQEAKITAEEDFKRTLTDPSDEEEEKGKSAAPTSEKEAEIAPGVTTGCKE